MFVMTDTNKNAHTLFSMGIYYGYFSLLAQLLFQILINRFQKLFGVQVIGTVLNFWFDGDGQIFGHLAAFNSLDTNLLQCFAEVYQFLVIVQHTTEL